MDSALVQSHGNLSDGLLGASQMEGLMGLLGCSRQSEEESSNAPSLQVNPASLTGKDRSQAPPNMKVAVKKQTKKDEKAIWEPEEFKAASGVVLKDEGDDRVAPKYEILHRQQVGASDTYLNIMEMDPSSDHCQELLVKIWLPNTKLQDITVDVLEDRVMLQAPHHRLNAALPYKVKKDSGTAKWDKVKGLLSVAIPVAMSVKYYSRPQDAFLDPN
mmetsp:Transcript_31238/g.57123  ORF Transcript_31238/g.57123 Transcript_31238/m.57123 type:complete len:216 (+) Transcript_31238:70-717(+)